jgi:rod shape determining protein RodA
LKKFFSLTKRFIQETDNLLLILITATSIFGVLMVYTTTRCRLEDGQTIARDATVMIIAAALGIIATLVISSIDYELIMKLWPIIAGFCVALMVLTLAIGAAPEERPDSRCWIKIGSIYFQSSELVKIGFLITFSMHLELVRDRINTLKSVIALGIHAMVPVGLVVPTGDMGSALVFIIMAIGLLFFAGLHWGYFACGGLLLLASSPLIWMFVFSEYQKNRFLALFRPEQFTNESFQQLLGLNALGSGGFWGTGFTKGIYTQGGIVPASENDMIFTSIGEETGFFGCIVSLGLLFAIVYRMIKIAKSSRDFSTQLFCYGMAVMISAQVLINIGMCLMILPVIGITLPFFSAGGSSTLCLYIGLGLVFSIYRFNRSRAAVNFRLSRISTPFSEF